MVGFVVRIFQSIVPKLSHSIWATSSLIDADSSTACPVRRYRHFIFRRQLPECAASLMFTSKARELLPSLSDQISWRLVSCSPLFGARADFFFTSW